MSLSDPTPFEQLLAWDDQMYPPESDPDERDLRRVNTRPETSTTPPCQARS